MPSRRGGCKVAALLALLLIGPLGTVSCGSGGREAGGTGEGVIELKTSPVSVVVVNRSSRGISGVRITLLAGLLSFTRVQGRLEPGERREFSLAEFRGRDTAFDSRLHRVKSVRVTATDADGKPIEVEVPWGR